jgi:hypothetical protein
MTIKVCHDTSNSKACPKTGRLCKVQLREHASARAAFASQTIGPGPMGHCQWHPFAIPFHPGRAVHRASSCNDRRPRAPGTSRRRHAASAWRLSRPGPNAASAAMEVMGSESCKRQPPRQRRISLPFLNNERTVGLPLKPASGAAAPPPGALGKGQSPPGKGRTPPGKGRTPPGQPH